MIELAELLHHKLAKIAGRNLTGIALAHIGLDGSDDVFELLIADRAFPTGLFQADFDFVAVKRTTRAVLLDYLDDLCLGAFEREKGPATDNTLAFSTEGEAPFGKGKIDNPIIIFVAIGTTDGIVDALIRAVTCLAVQALPPTADTTAFEAGPRVDHTIVVKPALRAFHIGIVDYV